MRSRRLLASRSPGGPCVPAQYTPSCVMILLVTDSGEHLMWGIDIYLQRCGYGLGDLSKSQHCCGEPGAQRPTVLRSLLAGLCTPSYIDGG